jgi:tetratricopeptide (TPR) repeat protein
MTAHEQADLGLGRLSRFEENGAVEDLDEAISLLGVAYAAIDPDQPARPSRAFALGLAHQYRWQLLDSDSDLAAATTLLQQASDGNDAELHQLAEVRLGALDAHRWWRDRDIAALDRALARLDAVATPDRPDDDPVRITVEAHRGVLRVARFEAHHGTPDQLGDLESAIGSLTFAVGAGSRTGPSRALATADEAAARRALGLAHGYRYERLGEPADLTAAIAHLASDTDAATSEPEPLVFLGRLRHEAAMRAADSSQLAEAIATLTTAIDALADTPALRHQALLELALAHWNRYRIDNQPADLRAAAQRLTTLIESPGLDPELSTMARVLRIVVWGLTGAPATDPADRSREEREVFAMMVQGLGSGTIFATPAEHPGDTMPARYANLVDRNMIAEQHAQAVQEYQRMAADHPQRSAAATILGLTGTVGRSVGVHAGTDRDESVRLLRDALDTAENSRHRSTVASTLATTLLERGILDGNVADLNEAIDLLEAVLAGIPNDAREARGLRQGLAGALHARYQMRGDLSDIDAALEYLLTQVERPHPDESEVERLFARASYIEARSNRSVHLQDLAGLAADIDELTGIVNRLPPDHPGTRETRRNLSLLRARRGGLATSPESGRNAASAGAQRGLRRFSPLPPGDESAVAAAVAAAHAPHQGDQERAHALFGAAAAMFASGDGADPGMLKAAAAYARQAADSTGPGSGYLPRFVMLLGVVLNALYDCEHDPHYLEEAIHRLRGVATALNATHVNWLEVNVILAHTYRQRDRPRDRAESRRVALAALRGHAWRVLLQSGTPRATEAAREAADDAIQVACWCLEDHRPELAMAALDAGRGLFLHSATVRSGVAERLVAAGAAQLASSWRAAASRVDDPLTTGDPELRFQVMSTLLSADGRATSLLDPPDIARVQATLHRLESDALVYLFLFPGGDAGAAVVVPARGPATWLPLPRMGEAPGGPLRRYVHAYEAHRVAGPGRRVETGRLWRAALSGLLDWAWTAAIGPLLDHLRPIQRLHVVPMGQLGLVPWHAARGPQGYLVEHATISHAVSARLLGEVAARPVPPVDGPSLIIGDPTQDLGFAGREATAIHRACYPEAVYLGYPRDHAAGPAVPASVLAWMAGHNRAVVHLACHGVVQAGGLDSSYLVLEEGQRLSAEELVGLGSGPTTTRIGTVSLGACTTHLSGRGGHDEAFSLSTAFLTAGARSVFGSLWPVPDGATSLLMFMAHHYHRRERLPAADALRAAQLWMLDPNRRPPADMPADLTAYADRATLAEPTAWAGFAHLGG